MKIAMIGQRGLPATHGGIERHVEQLSARLAARGHDVVVFCRPNYTNGEGGPERVHLAMAPTISSKHLEAFVHSGICSARTVGSDFDIVHFHAIGPGLFSPIPRLLSRAKVVQTIHGLDQDRSKWGGPARVVLRIGDRVSMVAPDAVIVVGHYLLDHYRPRRRPTVYIPNGVSIPENADNSIVEKLGLAPGEYVLFVGRLTPEKGVHDLLAAFSRLVTSWRLVVVGGSSFTDRYEQELRDLASRDHRVVMPGYIYGAELTGLYANAGIYAQPSLLEGVPLTVLEAAALGLPLVLSSIPAHVELFPSPVPGTHLFTPGHQGALESALRDAVAKSSVDRLDFRSVAEEIRHRYDWDHITEETEKLYLRLVA